MFFQSIFTESRKYRVDYYVAVLFTLLKNMYIYIYMERERERERSA